MPAIAFDRPLRGLRRARHALEERALRERPPGRRRWMPRPTVRLRLTLLYGSLFLIAGALLLGITYGLAPQPRSGPANVAFLLRSAKVRAKPVPGGFVFQQATN